MEENLNYRLFLIKLYEGKIEHKKLYLKVNVYSDSEFIEKQAEIRIYQLIIKDLKSKQWKKI